MKIRKHLLFYDDEKQVDFFGTPNTGGKISPVILLIHYTAVTTASSTIVWFQKPEAQASAHLLIDRQGTITQFAPFNIKTWHAGRSSWGSIAGLNSCSIGIELVNAGKLIKNEKGWICPLDRKKVSSDGVYCSEHKNEDHIEYWQDYSDVQLEIAAEVGALLASHYKLKELLGHDDVSPYRKLDPGPAFPMDNFRAKVLGRHNEEPVFFKTTAKLNIRKGAGTYFDTVAKPLPKGMLVELIDINGSWSYVSVAQPHHGIIDVEGWVYNKYLEPKFTKAS